jgi:hypothetical protein
MSRGWLEVEDEASRHCPKDIGCRRNARGRSPQAAPAERASPTSRATATVRKVTRQV